MIIINPHKTKLDLLAEEMMRLTDEDPSLDWLELFEILEEAYSIKLSKLEKLSIARKLADNDYY